MTYAGAYLKGGGTGWHRPPSKYAVPLVPPPTAQTDQSITSMVREFGCI